MSQKFSLYDDLTDRREPGLLRRRLRRARRRARREEALGARLRRASTGGGVSSRAACRAAGSSAWPSARRSCTSRRALPRRADLRASTRSRGARSGRMINRLADAGTAILVTTHYLEEAEQCNRLGFMVAGELVAEGTPSGVKAAQGGHLLELLVDQPQRAARRAQGRDGALARVALRRPRSTSSSTATRAAARQLRRAGSSRGDPRPRGAGGSATRWKTSSSASSSRPRRRGQGGGLTAVSAGHAPHRRPGAQGTDAVRPGSAGAGPGAGAAVCLSRALGTSISLT